MPKTKTTSPARSQGGIITPKRKTTRGSRSLCSPALSTGSGRLTSIIDQFKDTYTWTHTQTHTRTYYMEESLALSPCNSRSVLNDNTEIEEPRRKSWWKKLDETSHDVMEVLEDNRLTVNNAIEELIDIEILSQEKNNYTLDIPESSDNESIKSIVLPQRRLFPQKERTQPQKKYGHLIENRESLAKLHNTNTTKFDKTVNVGPRELFKNAKRSKITFPAALLPISPNKTAADKTREHVFADPKPQVRNIFGNRPANKRKNMFADFILSESESEDEIPEIQPKVFGFQKKLEQKRISSISKGRDASPASSITTDIEMDFRMLLPSSTMVENQLEDNMLADNTPIKRARLSKLSEAKESEAGTLQTNTTCDKTKQSSKSVASKNKSKASPEQSLSSSMMTRSMLKNGSKHDENVNTSVNQDAKGNKSRSKTYSKDNELGESPSKSDTDKQSATLNKSQKQNKSKTRNSPKTIETEIESEEIVINKSTNKSIPNTTATNKSVYEKEHTVDKTGSNDVKENEKEDDENNFTLEYENDDNEVVEEAVVHNDLNENQNHNTNKHNTVVLEKDSQETEVNKSRSNKSSLTNKSFQQKPAKIVEESVESQTEQYSADDNVDGNQKQETENVQNKDEVMINEEIDEDANNSREDMSDGKVIEENEQENEVEVNISQDNEGNENESEENEDEVNVSQENEEEMNGSQEKAENQNEEIENEVSEVEDEEEANESDENEDDANVSDVNEDEANESQEIEGEVNESQEIEEDVNESQEVETEVNESQQDKEEANESHEVESEVNESQGDKEEANESQEINEEAHESQEVVDAHASDEENDEEMDEDEEETANESEDNEASANESQEVANDEQESHELASEAESEEVEDDQQMDDSDEADKAIASDPEISDDNQADVMEVDGNEEQESDNESEQNKHESHEDRQNEVEPSEEIEEQPNLTHDTTGRHRKKDLNKSAEVILHDNTNFHDSLTIKGRNTSVRKTKSMINNLSIEQSIVPSRDSITFQDGTKNSSAEGSGWDSHRITRKTLRQTFGKDFTPRKSLRALVMEKSAKRQTEHLEMHSETVKFPLANSTEMPEDSNHHIEDIVESDHEASRRMRLTTLEVYLQKIKEQNMEKNRKMEAAIRNSLKKPITNSLSLFKVPDKPAPRRPKPAQSKPKKKLKPFSQLPLEVIKDMKYKPPKRFQPSNASWITKRLYKFLEDKLDAKYDYKNRIRAEKLVETIYNFTKDIRRHHVAPVDAVDVLKYEFAKLDIVRTHHEFYEFFHEFMPREVRIKVVPDIVNNIALPRHGVFSDIMRGNTHT